MGSLNISYVVANAYGDFLRSILTPKKNYQYCQLKGKSNGDSFISVNPIPDSRQKENISRSYKALIKVDKMGNFKQARIELDTLNSNMNLLGIEGKMLQTIYTMYFNTFEGRNYLIYLRIDHGLKITSQYPQIKRSSSEFLVQKVMQEFEEIPREKNQSVPLYKYGNKHDDIAPAGINFPIRTKTEEKWIVSVSGMHK
jgi:hypothetical protein